MLTVTLLAGGCGGDDGDAGQARTVDPTTTTTSAADDTATTAEAPAGVALDQIVIQLSDMPTGWSVSPPEEDGDGAFCEERDPFNEVEPQEEAEASFQRSEFGPFVASGASLYANDNEASQVMGLLTDMADACQSFTQTEDEGTEVEWRFGFQRGVRVARRYQLGRPA